MKTSIFFRFCLSFLLPLIWQGCQEIEPVSVDEGGDGSQIIEMKAIGSSADSLLVVPGVDSSGLAGGAGKYFARMIVTGIRYDLPLKSDSLTQAEAIFLDRLNPIQTNGRTTAYPSFDAGEITLNGDTLRRHLRQGRISGRDTLFGYRYQLRENYSYESGKIHRWRISGSQDIDPSELAVSAPSEMRVLQITPRSVSTGVPINVRWSCANPIVNIIISREGESLQKTWVPILHLRVRNLNGNVTIPEKIIDLLPTKTHKSFLFTFSSENKYSASIGGYPDSVLVESASLHNILLNVGY